MEEALTMLRNLFLKSLWDQRRAFFWWAVGLITLTLYTAGLYPSIATTTFTDYIKALPTALTALFGDAFSLATPEGYLNAYFFDMMGPIIFIIYAIGAGSGAIAGEEERGTLDLLMSSPMRRMAIVLHKFAAMVVGLFILGFVMWAGLVLAALLVNMQIDFAKLAQASLGSVLVGLVFGSLALAIGCIRGSRSMSMGLSAAITLAAYVLKTYAPLVEAMKPYQKLSPFYYANAAKPLVNGLNPEHVAVLVIISAVLLVVALVAFERRDVAV
jgi:ABC-2 type transport system permease protein